MSDYEKNNGLIITETEKRAEKPIPVSVYSPQIPHALLWDRTRTSAVRSLRLTA
jgi:hypothetical protein